MGHTGEQVDRNLCLDGESLVFASLLIIPLWPTVYQTLAGQHFDTVCLSDGLTSQKK